MTQGYVGSGYPTPKRKPAPRRAAPSILDPLAPLSDSVLQRQATTSVRAATLPIIQEIQRSLGADEKQKANAISGNTNALAAALAPYQQQTADRYGQAQQQQAASDAALRASLEGQGGAAANSLANVIASIGAPQSQGFVDQAQQTGLGAANAGYAQGSASLSALIGQGAAATNQAAQLPGIARIGGQSALNQLKGDYQRQRADKIGEITSQVPGQVASLVNSGRDREYNKAVAVAGLYSDKAKLKIQAQQAAADRAAKFQLAADKRASDLAIAKAKFQASGQLEADKATYRAEIQRANNDWKTTENSLDRKATADQKKKDRKAKAAAAKQKASKIDSSASYAGGYLVNGKGQFVNRQGQVVKRSARVKVDRGGKSSGGAAGVQGVPSAAK